MFIEWYFILAYMIISFGLIILFMTLYLIERNRYIKLLALYDDITDRIIEKLGFKVV